MLKKRAQGMPIRVIIIAVIALVVIFVLLAIFGGNIGNYSAGLNKILGDNDALFESTEEESGAQGNTGTGVSCSECTTNREQCITKCDLNKCSGGGCSSSERQERQKCVDDCIPVYRLCQDICS